ncbi:MAG: alkaline phosphatase family protein [Candidatus Aminicenantes bacterium]|nr:alkaline phosphatase family protein [Candidatus Aminicenantes bacterium]
MSLFKRTKKNKACVIGLDGVPYSLIKDLTQRGVMPALAQLIEKGSLHKMKASLPEISSVSWTDFMTGANSGSHGIFGFTDLKDNSYDMKFPNFSDTKKAPFWDTLGQNKKKCIIINQPSTYPARPINGVLISGFVALDLSKAVFPRTIEDSLNRMDYHIDIDTLKSREDPNYLWNELSKTLAGRQKAFDHFWKEDWDFFELVITGTDRLHHFLWDAYLDENHIYHQKFLDYYSQIDEFLAHVFESFKNLNGSLDGLYLLSDHGFTGIEQEVYLNVWLENEGYLFFQTPSPESLKDITPSSKAFAMDPSRIYIHDKNRFPHGCVNPEEKDSLKKEIAEKLKNLEHMGQNVIRTVYDTKDIYSGPHCAQGPDLIVLSEYGYDMKGSIKKKDIFGRSSLQGMHTWDDAFFWSNQQVKIDLSISDLAPIILSHLI